MIWLVLRSTVTIADDAAAPTSFGQPEYTLAEREPQPARYRLTADTVRPHTAGAA